MINQIVSSSVWTQGAADPNVWVFQNSGANLTLSWDESGSSACVPSPECWRFARAFRTSDSHGWRVAPDLVPPFPPPLPSPDVTS